VHRQLLQRRGSGRAALGLAWRARERPKEEELRWWLASKRRVEQLGAGGGTWERPRLGTWPGKRR
jgi:hypothetical protein